MTVRDGKHAAPGKPRATLEVGSAVRPVEAKHTAVIRLHYVQGMDKQSCPAIVCCGGRMDFHGAAMPPARTAVIIWVANVTLMRGSLGHTKVPCPSLQVPGVVILKFTLLRFNW